MMAQSPPPSPGQIGVRRKGRRQRKSIVNVRRSQGARLMKARKHAVKSETQKKIMDK